MRRAQCSCGLTLQFNAKEGTTVRVRCPQCKTVSQVILPKASVDSIIKTMTGHDFNLNEFFKL